MDVFEDLDRILKAFRWTLLQVELLEALAASAFLVVLLASAGAGIYLLFPEAESVRMVLLLLGIAVLGGTGVHVMLVVKALFRDQVELARLLRRAFPEVGPGLESVVSLRPHLDRANSPPFSAALLAAEAARSLATLQRLPPRPPRDLARVRRFIAATGALVGLLIVAAFLRPAEVATGVRRLAGLDTLPAWISLPAQEVDLLAYDLRANWLVPGPDGFKRLEVGEVSDIIVPYGFGMEIEGVLTRPARQGKVMVTSAGSIAEIPLVLTQNNRFSFVVKEPLEGPWRVEILTTDGARLREKTFRRITRFAVDPPSLSVEPLGTVFLGAQDAANLSYQAESRVGVAKIEAVFRFPFAPARPPARMQLKVLDQRQIYVSGELRFVWPDDPVALGGRVDLYIEVFDWASLREGKPGRSVRVKFALEDDLVRRIVEIEEAEALLADVLSAMAKGQVSGSRLSEFLSGREGGDARRWTKGFEAVLEDARKAVESGEQGRLEAAALALDEAIQGRWASVVLHSVTLLEREAARWTRLLVGHGGEERVRGSLLRAWGMLALLLGIEQHRFERADFTTTAAALAQRRLSALTKAREQVAWVTGALSAGAEAERIQGDLEKCRVAINLVAETYRRTLSQVERVAAGQITLSPKVLEALMKVREAQSILLDRTMEVAAAWKAAIGPFGEVGDKERLLQQIAEVRRRIQRIPVDRLRPSDAAEVERYREGIQAVQELVEGSDYVGALRAAQGLSSDMKLSAELMQEEADWLREEGEEPGVAMDLAARELRVLARLLRAVARTLAERTQRPAVPQTILEEIGELAERQLGILSAFNRAAEPLEPSAAAASVRRNMTEAHARLVEGRPDAAEVHQRQAVQDIQRLARAVEKGPFEATGKERRAEETVAIPRKGLAPSELVEEIRLYSGETPRPGAEALVRAYYEALLK